MLPTGPMTGMVTKLCHSWSAVICSRLVAGRSRIPLAMPSRSRTRNDRVSSSVGARNPDQASMTGWSHDKAPWSTNPATIVAVIDFVVDATAKRVSRVTGLRP